VTRGPWLVFLAGVLACGSAASTRGGSGPDPIGEDAVAEVVAPSGPIGFHYPPIQDQAFTYHRFDSLITLHPGGATQVQTFGRTAYLRVTSFDSVVVTPLDTMSDSNTSADTVPRVVLDVTLDSINQDPRSSMRQPVLDSVRGASWRVLMAPTGGVGAVTLTEASSIGDNLSGELARLFFPMVPKDGAAIGSRWHDSTETRIGGLSVPQTERAVTLFHVPQQDLNASPALRIEGRAALVRWGKDEQAGRTIELEGTGVDSTSYFLGEGGRFLGAEGADSVSMTFTIPAVGQSVPVIQVGRYLLREQAVSVGVEAEPLDP